MEKILRKLHRYFGGAFRMAVLDMEKGRWLVEPAISNIGYLRAENANGRHILMQPTDASGYLLADDLSWPVICHHHRHRDGAWRPGRMVVETSPRNYQVWIRGTRALSLPEKRLWLKRLLSDPGADPNNRWGRCPGFRNRKYKYRDDYGHYPMCRLIWVDWVQRASIPRMSCHIPEPLFPQPRRGGVCRRTISRLDYDRGDDSRTDFAYTLALLRRGYAAEEIRRLILSERKDWDSHRGEKRIAQYLNRTIRRAREILESACSTPGMIR